MEEHVMDKKTNILYILADDLGPWALHCYGNKEIKTPHLDRLAELGMLFSNSFCTSPVCSPARASILCGTIPSAHGVHDWIKEGNLPPNPIGFIDHTRTYTDILAEHGYTCALVGKWHLGDSMRPQHGISHWFCHPKGSGPYNNQPMIHNGELIETQGYITDVITNEAVSFLQNYKEKPFCLQVNYTAPHSPWTGHPEKFVALYEQCAFESCPQEPEHPWAGPLTKSSLGNREYLKGYFAAVTAMDYGIGSIMHILEETGLIDNTVVFFTSDNGFSCGQHGFWGKGNGTFPMNMYENSVKVPLIVSYKGRIKTNTSSDAMISQYDMMPTILELSGLPEYLPPHLPGVSFVPILTEEQNEIRDDVMVFDEYGPVRMIRTKNWKYIHRYPHGMHELYCLTSDPDERNNLINDTTCKQIIADLRNRLTRWFNEYANPVYDGKALAVNGSGQVNQISKNIDSTSAFSSERIVFGPSGFPMIDSTLNLQSLASYEKKTDQ